MPYTYHLYSTLPGEPNLGIWYLYQQQEEQQQKSVRGQPVRLAADLVEWVASRSIVERGPVQLSAGPYQYTCDRNGEVFATNQPHSSQTWYVIPDSAGNCLISSDSVGNMVWTAEGPGEAIKIKQHTGERNQWFKFRPE